MTITYEAVDTDSPETPFRVIHLDAAERAAADLLRALGLDLGTEGHGRHPAPDGPGLRRAAHAAPVHPDDLRQRRGARRTGPRPGHPDPLGLRAPNSALRRRRPRRLPARRPDPRPVQARPGRRT